MTTQNFRATRIISGREFSIVSKREEGRPLVLIHGGTPNHGAIAHGAHFWDSSFEWLDGRTVVAPDLAGFGATPKVDADKPFTFQIECLRDIISSFGLEGAHLVGYGSGGLAALLLAAEHPELTSAVTCVASVEAAPSGDGLEDLTLTYPPVPRWTRKSQKWALERLSYSNQLPIGVLESCVSAAQSQCYSDDKSPRSSAIRWSAALLAAKLALFKKLRESGIPRPVQLIWAADDCQTSIEQGAALYELISAKQPDSHFHIVNRAGSFPFLDQGRAFWSLVGSFK